MRPSDTSPEAWQVQIEIMRRKGPLERLLVACRMSDEIRTWEAREPDRDVGRAREPA